MFTQSLIGILSLLAVPPAASGHAQAPGCDSSHVAALPIIERPPTADTGQVLVLLLTGDGGWAHADEAVGRELLARGAAVVGLNMRSYLSRTKTPDILGQDASCIATVYMARWNRAWVMLLGYSRGADLAPFAAVRMPPALRQRLTMLALVSPSAWAGFTFHLIDLIRDVHRADDLPVAPEIARLADVRLVCIHGMDDAHSLCPTLTSPGVKVVALQGGHRITGGFDAMAEWLVAGLSPPPARTPNDSSGRPRGRDRR